MPIERPALLVQLQPITPWRCGAGSAGEPASLLPSDSLFGAVSNAMDRLGWLPEWLAEGAPSVRFGSLFPVQNDVFYAPLPESVRDYPGLRRVRLEAVRFAPLAAIQDLAAKRFDESRWVLDLASGCLQSADRAGAGGPFRPLRRQRAAVDRLTGEAAPAVEAEGIEFNHHSGLWTIFAFDTPEAAATWAPRLKAVFRLLADEGIGGWRAAGWGRSRRPRFREGEVGRLFTQAGWKWPAEPVSGHWWLLGLYAPAESDVVAWDAGAYQTLLRSGFTPGGAEKPAQRYVREGAVLASEPEPRGRLSEVEVEGAGYPVVRYGAGLVLPWQEGA